MAAHGSLIGLRVGSEYVDEPDKDGIRTLNFSGLGLNAVNALGYALKALDVSCRRYAWFSGIDARRFDQVISGLTDWAVRNA